MSRHHTSSRDSGTEFWGSLSSALLLACVRLHGQDSAATIERTALRRTIEHHQDALAAHGLATVPPAERAALLAARWTVLSGRRSGTFLDDAGRAHVVDLAPAQSSDGPFEPSTSIALLDRPIGTAWSTARAEAIIQLVSADLRWTTTHCQTDGGLVDAGYFAAASNTEVVAPTLETVLSTYEPASWRPHDDLAASVNHRRLVERLEALQTTLGPTGAAEVTTLATKVVLNARWGWLSDLGLDPGPLAAATRYVRTLGWLGAAPTVDLVDDGKVVVDAADTTLWSRLASAGAFLPAWQEAWSTSVRLDELEMTVSTDTRAGGHSIALASA